MTGEPEGLDDLPGSVREIAEVIGRQATLHLLGQLPATRAGKPGKESNRVILYVPKKLAPDHRLVQILGAEKALALVRAFGGEVMLDEKTTPAKDAYWSVRTSLSDGIEGLANWMSGTERVRADAPVPPKEKALPQIASRSQLSQQNTVTINVNQQPGENGEALAQRIAQAQARALAVRNRGKLYDQAVVY